MSKIKWIVTLLWIVLTIAVCWNIYNSAEETKKINEIVNMFLLMLGGFGSNFFYTSLIQESI